MNLLHAGMLLLAASLVHDYSAYKGWLRVTTVGLLGTLVLDITAIVLIGKGLFALGYL